jgi:site-specific DNA recombinase
VCRRYAELQGFTVVAEYEDAAISGASTLRPGYQKLLEDARKRTFDIVLAESLDRLSPRIWRMSRRSTSTSPTWASACAR